MHILITGAAGMIGRKLTARLVKDGSLNGQPIDRLTLIDVVAPEKPAGFAVGAATATTADLAAPGAAEKAVADRPDVIFHLAGVVSGEAETDFEKGYRVNLDGTRALLEAIRADRRWLQAQSRFHLIDRGVRRAVSGSDRRRFPSHAAHLLWHPEGDVRTAARRLHAARHSGRRRHQAAVDRGAAGQAEQGGVRFLLRHHPRAARWPGGDPAGRRQRAALACQPALGGRLPDPRGRPDARAIGHRINLTMPGVCCTVGEQIAALRRIAGDPVAARIRRAPDELVERIVAGWPSRFDARRSVALGFKVEATFDDIIRAHIEDELGAGSPRACWHGAVILTLAAMTYIDAAVAPLRKTGQIKIHGTAAFEGMRKAGQLVARCLDMLVEHVGPGVATDKIDKLVFDYAMDHGALPATLMYRGYKKSTCTSLNHVVCHGIPGDKALKDGDIINIDVTLILDGWHGDSSRMFAIGEIPRRAERLIEVTHEAMMRGIATIRPGSTTGDIGAAIQNYVEAQHMSVVRDFCGHGLGRLFHDEPNIVHVGRPGEGIVLKPGMFFTVEPMINLGRPHVKVLSDGWTAVTRDRSLSAQFEHTVGVTDTGVEVFTFSPAGLHKPPYTR